MKHNQYKGIVGPLWNIFRYYILGLLLPTAVYIWLKDRAHDTQNYYNAFYIISPTSPLYKATGSYSCLNENIKQSLLDNKHSDVLGRRSAEYYHVIYPSKILPLEASPVDKVNAKMYKLTESGRKG